MRLALTGRSTDALAELSQELTAHGTDVLTEPADITSAADRERLFAATVGHLGGLDVLVNVAGVGKQGQFSESSEAILRRVMEVNFFASAEMIRRAIPLLREGRQPAIVQMSSMCGRRAMPFWTEYSASKFAICGLLESLRAELSRFDIDVLLILPGLTRTNLGKNLLQTDGRMVVKFEDGMDPAYVARQTLRALQVNRAETVLGAEARWLIRATRWIPGVVRTGLAMYVRRRYASETRA
jgi:short-subunit dehydrogenase